MKNKFKGESKKDMIFLTKMKVKNALNRYQGSQWLVRRKFRPGRSLERGISVYVFTRRLSESRWRGNSVWKEARVCHGCLNAGHGGSPNFPPTEVEGTFGSNHHTDTQSNDRKRSNIQNLDHNKLHTGKMSAKRMLTNSYSAS